MAGAAARSPPRPRRAHRPRPGGSLLGVAALLRAARRAGSGGARLRGSPVGRCRAARLHRVPARVVAQSPAVRARARTSRGGRTAAQLRRERPQRNEPLARGPLRGRDGATARRLRARAARRAAGADPRPGRGSPAVCRRDGPHAARPRPACPRGRRVSADRGGWSAGRARDAPRARRRPTGRTGARRAAPAPGRLGVGQVVHQDRPCGSFRADRARAGAARHLARPQGGALRTGGPALAGAWPVRLSPGPAEARRVRDAREVRAQGSTSRRRRPSRAGLRCRGAGDRRGDRRPLRRRLQGGTRRRRRAGDQGQGAGDARPCRRARRLTGCERRGAALLRAGRGAQRRPDRRGATARAGRRDGVGIRSGGRGTRSLRACARAVRVGGVDASGGAGHRSAR